MTLLRFERMVVQKKRAVSMLFCKVPQAKKKKTKALVNTLSYFLLEKTGARYAQRFLTQNISLAI